MSAINTKLIRKIIKLNLLNLTKYKNMESKVTKIKILKGFNINQRILDR